MAWTLDRGTQEESNGDKSADRLIDILLAHIVWVYIIIEAAISRGKRDCREHKITTKAKTNLENTLVN